VDSDYSESRYQGRVTAPVGVTALVGPGYMAAGDDDGQQTEHKIGRRRNSELPFVRPSADVSCGSWPCQNSGAYRGRRNISAKLIIMKPNHLRRFVSIP
jgi:hypothetical protein